MKTLLYFTPRLVAIAILVLVCSSLLANETSSASVREPALNTVTVIASFALLLAVILLPLISKRNGRMPGK